MGEVYYIFPEPTNARSEIQLSSLVRAMNTKQAAAITRFVSRDGSAPKVGILKPQIDTDGTEYMYWVQMPFAEDERRFLFPSLERLVDKKGREVREHELLPTEEQMMLMDRFVEEMDLDSFGEEAEDG